jgi:hypothetical protein
LFKQANAFTKKENKTERHSSQQQQ